MHTHTHTHSHLSVCICVCKETAGHTAGGLLQCQGPHVARVCSHHHHLPHCPTRALLPCSPAPPQCSREHPPFTLCFTLVTFATDELFVEIYFAPHRLNQILFMFVLFYREIVFFLTNVE